MCLRTQSSGASGRNARRGLAPTANCTDMTLPMTRSALNRDEEIFLWLADWDGQVPIDPYGHIASELPPVVTPNRQ